MCTTDAPLWTKIRRRCLVEQHVQNALEVSEHGTIIEGGQSRLSGTARELLDSDVVRESYFGN